MMDKRGEKVGLGLGTFLSLFIAVLVGLVLIPAVGVFTGQATNTNTNSNETITAPDVNVTIDITGQSLLNTAIVFNGSSQVQLASSDFRIDEGVSTNTGLLSIQYTSLSAPFANRTVNLTYDFGADGFVDNAGARSLVGLIILFMALSIAIIALSPIMKNGLFDLVGKVKGN